MIMTKGIVLNKENIILKKGDKLHYINLYGENRSVVVDIYDGYTIQEFEKVDNSKITKIERVETIYEAPTPIQDNMIHFGERLKLVNDTKHRVCEEIREKLKQVYGYNIDGWYLTQDRIDKFLDQIEKGESDGQ